MSSETPDRHPRGINHGIGNSRIREPNGRHGGGPLKSAQGELANCGFEQNVYLQLPPEAFFPKDGWLVSIKSLFKIFLKS